MIRPIGRLLAVAIPLFWAWGATAGAPVPIDEDGRYQHTRCVVLASLTGPDDLEALADELDVLRDLDLSAVMVLVTARGPWTHRSPPVPALQDRLRHHADALWFEWRGDQPPAPWMADLGRPVRSVLAEAAYWQDRGYRLVPFPGNNVSLAGAATPSRVEKSTPPAMNENDTGSSSGLRFHW